MTTAAEIRGLKKRLGTFTLDIPQLSLPEGCIIGFIGENGAGKTTTMKLMMNMLFPDEGTVTLLGMNYPGCEQAIKAKVGYAGESNGYLQNFRLRELHNLIAPFYPTFDERRYRQFLDRFSLDESKKLSTLSQGKQKQFNLSMALSHHPALLLLDEPTANLDPLVRQEILDLLQETIEEDGTTVFFSTHITSDLDHVADYIAFLHKGRLLEYAEKDRMLEESRLVKGPSSLLTQELRPLLIGVRETPLGFVALTRRPGQVDELLGREALLEKATLEDIFIHSCLGGRDTSN